MIAASPFEYRWRYALHALIYSLGFFAPWERYTSFTLGEPTLWLALAALPARSGWLGFSASSRVVLVLGCLAAVVGASLRVWGAAYLGAGVVKAGELHGERMLADGPLRHVRNPLYLGTFLGTLAIALVMPPSGAIVTVLLIGLLQLRLIGTEERFLSNRFGEPYRAYCAAVPRLLPSLLSRVPASGAPAHWISAVVSELFFVGCAVSFLAVGSSYNSNLILRGIVISFGASLIARALLPPDRAAAEGGGAAQP